jgi:parallel beta-helix repeat protein
MKIAIHLSLITIHVLVAAHAAFAQGSLTPPGAPAPTMKTLDQVEPRIPVDATHTPGDTSAVFKITQEGSYYLTGNITGVAGKNGILVQSSGVTLDLMGHSVGGTGVGSLNGIFLTGFASNVTIRNGTVEGWAVAGINVNNQGFGLYEDLRITGNGTGMSVGDGVIQRCIASNNTNGGIFIATFATVRDCTSKSNGADGFSGNSNCTFTDCWAMQNAGNGFNAGETSTLTNCVATFNSGTAGIVLDRGSSATGCTSSNNIGANSHGFSVGSTCTITGCVAFQNSQRGITTGGGCVVTHCTAGSNSGDAGIFTGGDSNLSHCNASENGSTAASSSGIQTGNNCTVSNCTASENTGSGASTFGIQTGTNNSVTDCTASLNTSTNGALTNATGGGIAVLNRSTVLHCTASQNKGDGIRAPTGCLLKDNTGQANGNGTGDGAGIHTTGSDNRIESNNVASNDRGIDVGLAGNLIIKNSASGNGPTNNLNYVIAASNRYGPIIDITATGAAAVSGNSAADTTTTTHPWANFSY